MSVSQLGPRDGKFANARFHSSTGNAGNVYNKNNDRSHSQFRREGGYAPRHINDTMGMGSTYKTKDNSIVGLNSKPLYQRFLQELNKATLGTSGDRSELGDIVFMTPDGLSVLATENQFVEHKLNSKENADSEQYKSWERLQATLEAAVANAEDEVGVLKIEFKVQQLADAKAAAAKAVESVGETSPRPLPDVPRVASPDGGVDITITPRVTRSLLQRVTGSGPRAIEPTAEAADGESSGTSSGDDAEDNGVERGSAAQTRASSPVRTQEQLAAEELTRDILKTRKELLDAKVKKIMGQLSVKEEETRLKSRLGRFNSFREVAIAQYRATATLGWSMYGQYFDIATVQTILSLLGAADASGTAPYSLFQMVMEDWGSRCRRLDLRHCAPAMYAEQMLQPFITGRMGIDDALAVIQRLRANASYCEWTPPAKALGTLWKLTERNNETAAALDNAGALDVQEITWDHYNSYIDKMRQVPGDACRLTLNQRGL
jgi:hypothetical protein